MNPLLAIDRLTVRFGGLIALDDVSIRVQPGAIHSVIGPNGAGKTTLINVITGVYRPSSGTVRFAERRIDGSATDAIASLGIARTFQNTELFPEMTARENVLIGLHRHIPYGFLGPVLHAPSFRRAERTARAEAESLLELVGLHEKGDVPAGILALGEQRRLELARALASRPRLLLLDEPAAGLRAAELDALAALILRLRHDLALTVVLIDHVMRLVMRLSERITVLNYGRYLAEGTPAEVRQNSDVVSAYLGKASHARS